MRKRTSHTWRIFRSANGKTPAQIMLRFLTQQGIAAIPRSSRPEHIRENFDIFDFRLTEDELALPLIGRPNSPELVEMSLTW